MVYTKLVLDDRKVKKDNIYPVVGRVTHQRRSTTFVSGVRIEKVAGKVVTSHPNHLLLNTTIGEFYLKVQKAVLSLQEDYSIEALKEQLEGNSKLTRKVTSITFNDFSNQLVSELFSVNKIGNALVYQTASNRLIGFSKQKQLKFKEIDYIFLEAFKRELMFKGVRTNSISNYLRTIRAIFNRAIKAKLIDRTLYPFTDVKIKSERTAKRAVLISDLNKIYKLDLGENTREWHARNYFFLSFSMWESRRN